MVLFEVYLPGVFKIKIIWRKKLLIIFIINYFLKWNNANVEISSVIIKALTCPLKY